MTTETDTKTLKKHLDSLWVVVGSMDRDIHELRRQLSIMRNTGDLHAPIPTGLAYVPREIGVGCAGPAPEGGSRADRPLYGYQDEAGHDGYCVHCAQPASEHGCAEVNDG